MRRIDPVTLSFALGVCALALIVGALGFQYIGRYPPCEMCQWQRWPHIAAAVIGIVGAGLIRFGLVDRSAGRFLAAITILLIAISGGLGVYHAGVEWHWWPGPKSCTGPAFKFQGTLDLTAPVVMCDAPAWRLFGLSLAGYNAIISLGIAALGAALLMRSRRRT